MKGGSPLVAGSPGSSFRISSVVMMVPAITLLGALQPPVGFGAHVQLPEGSRHVRRVPARAENVNRAASMRLARTHARLLGGAPTRHCCGNVKSTAKRPSHGTCNV